MSEALAAQPNYIGIKPTDRSRYIYRIMSMKRLEELFVKRQNVLVRPSLWEDPFENFILNSPARMPDGTTVTFGFNNDFFGQCWTLKSTSDAMWRIYSPKKDAVRVRTTIRKLADSLSTGLADWAHQQVHIGKVQYLKDVELIDFGNEVFTHGLQADALARTLLVKRKAFLHEKEVRLLYFEKDPNPQSDLYAYSIDPHALIDQIMIDPRVPLDRVENFKKQIRKKTGFTGKLVRSLLYAPPDGMIFPIGA